MFCPRCGTYLATRVTACTLCGNAFEPGAASHARLVSPARDHTTAFAGFWRRAVALLLDAILLFFPAATVRVMLGLSSSGLVDYASTATYWAVVIELMMDWLYAATLLSSRSGATLGMRVMGIRIARVDGSPVSFSRATWRFFAQLLNLVTLGIGYLVQVFSPRRQTLHDMVTDTVVVRVADVPAIAPVLRASA
jgi:uncharacterized RDD family membrane protein YckC